MTGWNSKKMMAYSSGSGKSVWAEMVNALAVPNITLIDSAEVDKKTWYTVQLNALARDWLKDQPKDEWHEHSSPPWGRYYVDVTAQLYTALMLKWNNNSY